MGFDTKYRPRTYEDVLGQDATVEVLRQLVREGRGFRQSYVFCGQHGSGKTTLGRIFARALLCTDPQDGNPCDKCDSCAAMLEGGSHETFEELDAASKSKKEDLDRIVDDVGFATFSGQRHIYLFDESHQLTKGALDKLLKPMEDNVLGSEDKQLVCIFCTTEPEKMRSTIFSRCAPAFVIRVVPPEGIAERLAKVCEAEGIAYEPSALVTIAEIAECHIRDALMKMEGVSLLGGVTTENIHRYFQLGANVLALDILDNLGRDLGKALEAALQMAHDVSPSSAYERLAEASLCAYRHSLGVGRIPAHWNRARIEALASRGSALLGISSRFAAPPHRANKNTLVLDVGLVHHSMVAGLPASKLARVVVEVAPSGAPAEVTPAPPPVSAEVKSQPAENAAVTPVVSGTPGKVPPNEPVKAQTTDGVWVDPRGIGKGSAVGKNTQPTEDTPFARPQPSPGPASLSVPAFRELVQHHVRDLKNGGVS